MTKLNKSLWVTFTMALAIAFCCLIIGQTITAKVNATMENVEKANLIKQSRVPLPDLVQPSKKVMPSTALSVAPTHPSHLDDDGNWVDTRPRVETGGRLGPEKVAKPWDGVVTRKGGGQDLGTATVISTLPYTDSDNTTGASNTAAEDCGFGEVDGPDLWYAYTPTTTHYVDITMCNSDDSCWLDHAMWVYVDAHTPGEPYAADDDGCDDYGPADISSLVVESGHTYYIVVSGWEEGCYTLDVTAAPDPLDCPEGALTEGESCGELNNDMEYTDPYTTPESITDGDVYCGTLFTGILEGDTLPTRDRDFYEIVIPEGPATVCHIQARGDFGPTGTYMMVDDSGAFGGAYGFSWFDIHPNHDDGVENEIWTLLEPGKYYIRVNLNSTTTGKECGSYPTPLNPNYRYVLSMDQHVPVYQDMCFNPEPIGDVTDHAFDLTGMTGGESGIGYPGINMWFEYTSSCNGLVRVDVCTEWGAADWPLIAAYGECHGDVLAWWYDNREIGCAAGGPISVQLPMSAGQTVLIEVASVFGSELTGTISTQCMELEMHNDDCADAIDIGSGPIEDYFFWTLGATTDTTDCLAHYMSCSDIGADVWYTWTSECTGPVEVSLCEDNPWDTKIGAYLGSECYTTCMREPIACNDDGCGAAGPSSMWIDAVAGQTYLLRIGSWYRIPDSPPVEAAGTLDIRDCSEPIERPENDRCEDAYNVDLYALPGDTAHYCLSGNSTDASDATCLYMGNAVWLSFTLIDTCADVTVEYCHTEQPPDAPGFSDRGIITELVNACPCTDGRLFGTDNYFACTDGETAERYVEYYSLNPGVYYWAVEENDQAGLYSICFLASPVVCQHCDAQGNECDEGVARFQLFDQIDNTTGSCDFYVDFYDSTFGVATVYKGINYDFRVENTTSEWPGDVCGVWVDWNRDFDFFDAGETIPVFGVPGRGPYTGVFSPPLDAFLGKTRLRVRVTYGLENLLDCGPVPYGEVEDYALIVDEFLCADVNCDDAVDGADIEYLKDYYFNGGPEPCLGLIVGDANGDGDVNIGDIIYTADHVYRDGPAGNCLGL